MVLDSTQFDGVINERREVCPGSSSKASASSEASMFSLVQRLRLNK